MFVRKFLTRINLWGGEFFYLVKMIQTKAGRVSKKRFIQALCDYFDKIIWNVVIEAADSFVDTSLLDPIRGEIRELCINRTIENIEQKYQPGENLTGYLAIISEYLLKQLGGQNLIISFLTNLVGHLFLQLDFFIEQNTSREAVEEMEKAVKEAIIINYFEAKIIPLVQKIISRSLNVSIDFLEEFLNKIADLFKRNLLQSVSLSDIETYIESALISRGVNNLTICAVKAIISGFIFEVVKYHSQKEFYQQLDAVSNNNINKYNVDNNFDELIDSILINWLNNSIITELSKLSQKPELEEFLKEIGDSLLKIAQFRIEGRINKQGFENALASIKFLLMKVKGINHDELDTFFSNLQIAVEKIAETPKSKNEIDSITKLLEFKDLESVSLLEL